MIQFVRKRAVPRYSQYYGKSFVIDSNQKYASCAISNLRKPHNFAINKRRRPWFRRLSRKGSRGSEWFESELSRNKVGYLLNSSWFQSSKFQFNESYHEWKSKYHDFCSCNESEKMTQGTKLTQAARLALPTRIRPTFLRYGSGVDSVRRSIPPHFHTPQPFQTMM